jgi:hypothetical protein
MAKKNFKNKVWNWVVETVKFIAQVVGIVAYAVWCLLAVITSPVWYSIMIFVSPSEAADFIWSNAKYDIQGWFGGLLEAISQIAFRFLMNLLWAPIIAMLPMKYRQSFITSSDKPLSKYSVKTQLAYYKRKDAETKKNLLRYDHLSAEARKEIWQIHVERENWVDSGKELTLEQISELLDRSKILSWRYFKKHTPNKDELNLLINRVRHNYAGAQEHVLINLICQQRPSSELIGKLLTTGNKELIARVNSIIDWYADMDAVNFRTDHLTGIDDEAERKRIVSESWINFCKHKEKIHCDAQKRMGMEQFKVFVETGHKLDYEALRYLCLDVKNLNYLALIIEAEYDQIDEPIQTALKSEFHAYRVYLEEKAKRTAKQQEAA